MRTLDVLCSDELGYLSAELSNTMDHVSSHVIGKFSFMGGVLVFSMMDTLQIQPIKAKPAIYSHPSFQPALKWFKSYIL